VTLAHRWFRWQVRWAALVADARDWIADRFTYWKVGP